MNWFSGQNCEINIDDCVGFNNQTRCQNLGVCVDQVNDFECNCSKTGYQGRDCSIDVDECAQLPQACIHGQCHNLMGSYRCNCKEGIF